MAKEQIFTFGTYKKKPVDVQCTELTEIVWENIASLPNYVTYVSHRQIAAIKENDSKIFLIDTLEGLMKANIGDMLIIGVKGEIYSCAKDIFEQTYTEVTNE